MSSPPRHRKRSPVTPRAVAFKAAIAYARTTVIAWCADHEVTPGHLYKHLAGERPSPPLAAKVDAFIEKHVPASSPV